MKPNREKNNDVKKYSKEHSTGWLCPSSQQGAMWLVLSFPEEKKKKSPHAILFKVVKSLTIYNSEAKGTNAEMPREARP